MSEKIKRSWNPFSRKNKGPRKPPQLWLVFKATRESDPAVVWWMAGIAVAVMAVVIGVSAALSTPWFGLISAVPMGILSALIVLGRRAEAAMYRRMDGQPGASGASLGMLRRGGWTFEENPVAVDARTKDLVFRGYSKRGVVLVSEGPVNRVGKLLEKEEKKAARLLPGVPVHRVMVGNNDGQVPLAKLGSTVLKLKGKLTRAEVEVIGQRLQSMGGLKAPVPHGVDPTKARVNRRAMRGNM